VLQGQSESIRVAKLECCQIEILVSCRWTSSPMILALRLAGKAGIEPALLVCTARWMLSASPRGVEPRFLS
jgi:hypothetical protein